MDISYLKRRWEENQRDWNLPLSKLDKALVGAYIIASDWMKGKFPPRFPDRQTAWDNEIKYGDGALGPSQQEFEDFGIRKPFNFQGPFIAENLSNVIYLTQSLKRLGIHPPASILEIGCGSGWLSEMLALMGFAVTGTSISGVDIEIAKRRAEVIKVRGVDASLSFITTPMETVQQHVGQRFDVAVVYEALHHAFDWKQTIESVAHCLNPLGWFLICNEPNVTHTAVSYRIAKLSNTHEIGFRRSRIMEELHTAGFTTVQILRNRFHFWYRPHWIAGRKEAE